MGTVPLNPCQQCGAHMPEGTHAHQCPEVVLVCGSREWEDADAIRERLRKLPKDSVVIAGGARGADKLAAEIAAELGYHVAVCMAQWDRYGGAAGRRRNHAMLQLRPTLVIAYTLGTPGTQHTIAITQQKGIPLEVYTRRDVIQERTVQLFEEGP
jgi:hypothetical protein